VRRLFDRVSAFMVARAPHRADADGLTVTLIVFDALAVAGADLRAARLTERRARLEQLLGGAVRLTPVLELNPALHHALVADGWEGTVPRAPPAAISAGIAATSGSSSSRPPRATATARAQRPGAGARAARLSALPPARRAAAPRSLTVHRRHDLGSWLHKPRTGKIIRHELEAATPLVRWLREHVGPSQRGAPRAG
jgi:hypothetical protein